MTEPPPVRLTAAQRAHVAGHFDADAIEQIANLIRVDERRFFLHPFGGIPGEPSPLRLPGDPQEVSYVLCHSDPRIQELIEQMWVPYWDHLPPGALDDPTYSFPGRALVRVKRQQALEDQEQ
jgi:hypothetical protein